MRAHFLLFETWMISPVHYTISAGKEWKPGIEIILTMDS